MKFLSMLLLFSLLLTNHSLSARTLEINVNGMTCAFCVYSLKKKFKKIDSVTQIKISLKTKKIRLETEANSPSIETIKKMIREAGFTPTKVTIISP